MPRRRIPVWLMGLTNLPYGLYGGVVAFAIPQVLSSRHVAETAIAGVTAIGFSPGFWAFLFSPILDVRFSRRTYAVALACLSAVSLVAVFTSLSHLALLEIALTTGFFCAYLYQCALAGWLSTITSEKEEKTVSVWITIANVGGFALMAVICNQLVRHLPTIAVALLLGSSMLLPVLAFRFMPAPGPDRRLASESFPRFFRDLGALVKRRQVLMALVLFVAPAATFSLTNFLGARGEDFHASAGFIGLAGGAGAAGGVVGCLLFSPLSRLMPLRPLYLSIGLMGALFTLGLILLPLDPTSFAVAVIGENLFQSLAITCSTAIIFEIIGRDNPLASTTFCFICSAYCLPISYMLYVDAAGFSLGGISGSFALDAITGIVACLLLGVMLLRSARHSKPSRSGPTLRLSVD